VTTRRDWIAGARPKTLPAAIAPVIVGTAFAGDSVVLIHALLALIVGVLLQVGVNYANDYSDGVRGTDADRVGPIRLVGSGIATPQAVKNAAILSFSLASVAGLILASRTNWLLILVGAFAIISAWTYTGGPRPYGYEGFGEISVFLFFGLVATLGTYYVQVGSLSEEIWLASFAMGSLACSILVLNNLRDRSQDELAQKRTLAVRIGDTSTRNLYRWLMFFALAIAVALSFFSPLYLSALATLPWVARAVRLVRDGAVGVDLISILVQTGRIQIAYAAAISLAALLVGR
jgi:1,4-dihydroxy-2-naphthoate octaprenyltransferase